MKKKTFILAALSFEKHLIPISLIVRYGWKLETFYSILGRVLYF